jgi:isopenicillin N synthase-like dioxygenase
LERLIEGVDEAVVKDAFAEAKKFFDEPAEVKKELGLNEHYRGYHPLYDASSGETGKGTNSPDRLHETRSNG